MGNSYALGLGRSGLRGCAPLLPPRLPGRGKSPRSAPSTAYLWEAAAPAWSPQTQAPERERRSRGSDQARGLRPLHPAFAPAGSETRADPGRWKTQLLEDPGEGARGLITGQSFCSAARLRARRKRRKRPCLPSPEQWLWPCRVRSFYQLNSVTAREAGLRARASRVGVGAGRGIDALVDGFASVNREPHPVTLSARGAYPFFSFFVSQFFVLFKMFSLLSNDSCSHFPAFALPFSAHSPPIVNPPPPPPRGPGPPERSFAYKLRDLPLLPHPNPPPRRHPPARSAPVPVSSFFISRLWFCFARPSVK